MFILLFKTMQRARLNSQIIYAELQLEKLESSSNEELKEELSKHIEELKAELESLC